VLPPIGGTCRPRSFSTLTEEPSQYASAQIMVFAAANGLTRSMGLAGYCWDNAMAESFFATLKPEFRHRRVWPTKKATRTEGRQVDRGPV
jgi:putative transposase